MVTSAVSGYKLPENNLSKERTGQVGAFPVRLYTPPLTRFKRDHTKSSSIRLEDGLYGKTGHFTVWVCVVESADQESKVRNRTKVLKMLRWPCDKWAISNGCLTSTKARCTNSSFFKCLEAILVLFIYLQNHNVKF